ncbi:MAG: FG-GAP repeat protein [Rhodothermales bacterium]
MKHYTRQAFERIRLLLAGVVVVASHSVASGQIFELPRTDTTSGDFFGTAVAIDGERVLVGATAVNTCGVNSGAAYLYERTPGREEWRAVAQLVPSDCQEGRFFGRSVSISGDYAVVASSREFFSLEASNAAYVFERDSLGAWREAARLTGLSEEREGAFATSVSIDGERILVTTSGDPVHGRFGGAAYIFERDQDSGAWEVAARLTTDSGVRRGIFGTNGSLNGNTIAVSASTYFRNRPGSLFVFERSAEGSWQQTSRFGGIDDFFISVDAGKDRVIAGESKAGRHGAARIFERGSSWRVAQTLVPSEPYDAGAFGSTVAIEGDYALVVGYDEQLGLDFNIDRVVFVFKYHPATDTWRQHFIIDVGELAFGASLDIDGAVAVIGSASESAPGTAYVVRIPE